MVAGILNISKTSWEFRQTRRTLGERGERLRKLGEFLGEGLDNFTSLTFANVANSRQPGEILNISYQHQIH